MNPIESRETHDARSSAISYNFTRPDGVRVTTVLQGGKAHIMEERGEGAGSTLTMLERSQFTVAEVGLLKEIGAID